MPKVSGPASSAGKIRTAKGDCGVLVALVNYIGTNGYFTMDNLILQLESAFDKVTAKTYVGLIKKIRDVEDTFWRDDAALDKQN